MSKEQGFVEAAAQSSFVPSAPPSYSEAMQQAGGAFPPMPPQHMPMPMPLPIANYTPVQPAPDIYAPPVPPPTQVTNVVLTSYSQDKTVTFCHVCNSQIMTTTVVKHKCLAHFFCCCLMFSCPCFSCVPYCMDSCKIVKHYCPNCKSKLGTYRP